MERHQHVVVKLLSHLGQVWVYASHKPELLTTSMMVFGRERPTFGDEMISIASYCFQKFSHVNIEQQECCANFCDFSGFVWTFSCINLVFNAFYVYNWNLNYMRMLKCIKIGWKIKYVSLGACLGPIARNGNEFQTPGHRWLSAKRWDTFF